MDDPTDVGLVVEDVLDGHPGEGFPSTSQNLLDSIRAVGLLLAHSASDRLVTIRLFINHLVSGGVARN